MDEILSDLRYAKICTLRDMREVNLAAKDARRFRKWRVLASYPIECTTKGFFPFHSCSQHEHSQETMAGHDFQETIQCDMHNSVSGHVQSPQSAHLWKNNRFPVQPGASAGENKQLLPVSTSNSPVVGTWPPSFCQSHLQKDKQNPVCPLMMNPDGRASKTMIVLPSTYVNPNRNNDSGYGLKGECVLSFVSGFSSNEMEVESQMYDNNDSTLALPGNQDALPSNAVIVAMSAPLVHDNDDPALPLPVTIATHRYFGIEVNVMLAGVNGAAIVGFAPRDSYLKQVFAAAVGVGFFGSLFAILCRRKLKQSTILSKIGITGTSSAVLVALGAEFGLNFVVIALACLIFAVVMMISD